MKVLPLRCKQAGPSRGSDDHVEMTVPSPVRDVKIVSPISTFVLNTLTLKEVRFSLFVFFVALWRRRETRMEHMGNSKAGSKQPPAVEGGCPGLMRLLARRD